MFSSTLEQWQLLRSVVQLGSIAKAADAYHRSQPSVSYQLNQLQERLGLKLLTLEGRHLVLTREGRSLLEQASLLLDDWNDLERRAQAYYSGERSVLSLVIDSLLPKDELFEALKLFNQLYPNTQVHVKEVVRDEGALEIQNASGDLYIVAIDEQTKLGQQFVLKLRLTLVMASEHPLFDVPENFRMQQLSRYPLIQIVDKSSQQTHQSNFRESWYFTSVDSAKQAVLNQLGYGWLPYQHVKEMLENGQMRQVDPVHYPDHFTSLYMVTRPDVRYDPCVDKLKSIFLDLAEKRSDSDIT